jgi:probable rRNA maturation factor
VVSTHGRIELTLQNPQHVSGLDLRGIRRWLSALLSEVAADVTSLTVRFTSDREVRRLNQAWRQIDRPTDVLSFPGESTPEGRHLGDIVISIPTARRQARQVRHAVGRELRELILHGVLHCLGYDHERDDGAMDRLERQLRSRWIDEEPDGR